MTIRKSLSGTTTPTFQIGKRGNLLKWNSVSPALEARDKDDLAFSVVRGAPPVDDNDLVTLKHFNDNNAANVNVAVAEITVGLSSIAPTTGSIPAGARITSVRAIIDTPYSAGASMSVALTGGATILPSGDVDLEDNAGSIFHEDQDVDVGVSAKTVDVTIGGAPAAGACRVQIFYVTPNNIT